MKHNVITRTTLQTFMKTATMGFIMLASALFSPRAFDAAAADSPNILLILTDDKDQSVIEGGSKHGKNAAKSDRLAVI